MAADLRKTPWRPRQPATPEPVGSPLEAFVTLVAFGACGLLGNHVAGGWWLVLLPAFGYLFWRLVRMCRPPVGWRRLLAVILFGLVFGCMNVGLILDRAARAGSRSSGDVPASWYATPAHLYAVIGG